MNLLPGKCVLTAMSELRRILRSFLKSNYSVRHHLPCGLRAHKNVPANLDFRVTIDATQRNSMHFSIHNATQSRATLAAETQASSMLSNE